MKQSKIVRNIVAVSAVLSAFLPFGAFAGPILPTNFVRPTLKAPQASDMIIVSLQNQIASLQKKNADLSMQLKIEQCPDQVDECTRLCYVGADVCGEGDSNEAGAVQAECFDKCRFSQWR